jgi:hypothetical protein
MNARRKLLIGLGTGAIAAPLCSFAQSPERVYRVGVLSGGDPRATRPLFEAFETGLRELGYEFR